MNLKNQCVRLFCILTAVGVGLANVAEAQVHGVPAQVKEAEIEFGATSDAAESAASDHAMVVVDEKTGQWALGAGSAQAIEEFQRKKASESGAESDADSGLFRWVGGGSGSIVWYFPTLNGSTGLQAGDFLEVGAEGGFIIALVTAGFQANVYAKISPIPVGFGKRIYVGAMRGHANLLNPSPTDEQREGDGGGLSEPYTTTFVGYRHLRSKRSLQDGYWFAEVGRMSSRKDGVKERFPFLKVGVTVLIRSL